MKKHKPTVLSLLTSNAGRMLAIDFYHDLIRTGFNPGDWAYLRRHALTHGWFISITDYLGIEWLMLPSHATSTSWKLFKSRQQQQHQGSFSPN